MIFTTIISAIVGKYLNAGSFQNFEKTNSLDKSKCFTYVNVCVTQAMIKIKLITSSSKLSY